MLEAATRLYFFIKNKINPPMMTFSESLGWQTKAKSYKKGNLKCYGPVIVTTTEYGFRVFGDVNTDKTKILVLGDSYTFGNVVSDGDLYYDHLKRLNNSIEIFAYGCGGYGTLQEYMILDKYFDEIKPDIILWQFSDGDFINNDHELESSSIINNHMQRPYYIDGKIKLLYPTPIKGVSYHIFYNSHFLRWLNIKLSLIKAVLENTLEYDLNIDSSDFQRAKRTTSLIMGLVRQRVGAIPIVAFSVDEIGVGQGVFKEICKEHNIIFVSQLNEVLNKLKLSGQKIDCSPGDKHWNKYGHYFAGRLLLEYLEKSNLVEKRRPLFP